MQLRDLEYIVKVAETGNFNVAARECNVSQPALSIQIKKIEEQLGVQIFEREKKKFIITDAGKLIIEKAKAILQAQNEIKDIAKTFKNPLVGQLKMGAFPTLAPYFLPKIMPNLSKKYPQIEFLLVEEKTNNLLEMLENGELDAAFIALPVANKNLQSIYIFDDEFLAALPSSHPLAKKERIHRSEIKNDKILLLEEGHCLRDQALEYCELMGKHQVHDFRATSMETLREMVAQGLGITLMPELAAIPRKNISYVKFMPPAPTRQIGFVFRRSHPRAKFFEDLAAVVKRN